MDRAARKDDAVHCRGEGPMAPHFTVVGDEPTPPLPTCPGCGRGFVGSYRVIRLPARDDVPQV